MKTVYSYFPGTGYYQGPLQLDDSDRSPLEPDVFLLPGNTTETPPPAPGPQQRVRWVGGQWLLENDTAPEPAAPEVPPTLEQLKAARASQVKAEAAERIAATDWQLTRAREREAAGWGTYAEIDAVLALRESIRQSSSAAEEAVHTLEDAQAVQSFEWGNSVVVETPRRLTHKQFMDRFTDLEMQAVLTLVAQSTAMRTWWTRFEKAQHVNLTDYATQAGVQALEIAGVLAEGRAAEVLAP